MNGLKAAASQVKEKAEEEQGRLKAVPSLTFDPSTLDLQDRRQENGRSY